MGGAGGHLPRVEHPARPGHHGGVGEPSPGVLSARLSARLSVTGDGLRFRSPAASLLMSLYVGIVLALSIGGLVMVLAHPDPQRGRAGAVGLCCIVLLLLVLLVRVVRSASLVATRSGMVVRTYLRTYRWAWRDVEAFEVVVRPFGANRVPRRFLRVHLSDGRRRNLTELNESARRGRDTVTELAQALAWLRAADLDRGAIPT